MGWPAMPEEGKRSGRQEIDAFELQYVFLERPFHFVA